MSNTLSEKIAGLRINREDRVYIYPDIPSKKVNNALKSYGNPAIKAEDIIILVDETLFGSAKEGIIITNDYICAKNSFAKPIIIKIDEIKSISYNKKKVFINGDAIINCYMPDESTCKILFNFIEEHIKLTDAIPQEYSKSNENSESIIYTDENDNRIKQLEKDALGGNIEAQYNLAMYYFDEDNQNRNIEKAFYWFDKVAESGDAETQYQVGFYYDTCYNEDKAFYWYKKAAENGHSEAQESVGLAYMLGKGVEPDEVEGHKWFRTAAENGDIDAMWSLGKSYLDGNGTEQNYRKAFYWFKKGAEKGEPMSQNSLGVCYLLGRGTDIDREKAFYWVKKSAEQGNKIAQGNLGDYYRKGYGTSIDMSKAHYWYQKAAEQGDSYAAKALESHFSSNEIDMPTSITKDIDDNNKDNHQSLVEDKNICKEVYKHKLNEDTKPDQIQKVIKVHIDSPFSDKFCNIIAGMDGYAVVVIALMKNNAADRIFTILSKIPGIGMFGIMGKVVLSKPLNWLSIQIVEYGEGVIMDKLVCNWKKRQIGYDDLLRKIDSIPSFVLEESVIIDSKALLDKYYN